MTDSSLIARLGRAILVQMSQTFDSLLANGAFVNASGVDPNGTANGQTLTVDLTGSTYGNATDANVNGELFTVTSSLIAGSAFEEVFAPGSTITITSSLSVVGVVHLGPIDGGNIYEFVLAQNNAEVFVVSDFDSIYSTGDRVQAGILTGGEYGWSFVFSPGDQGYDNTWSGNGPAASGTTSGAAYWFSTVGGETLDIRGFRLIGGDSITSYENFWTFRGGIAAGNYSNEPYFNILEAHNPNQGPAQFTTPTYDGTYRYTDYIDEPKYYTQFSHYEFVYVSGPRPDVRWCNEIWLRIAHSNLDGGDRRPDTAAPSKAVSVSFSSDWSWDTGAGHVPPQQGWFDGQWEHLADKLDNRLVHVGAAADFHNPVNTVGAWIQFVFPRPVIFKNLQFINWNNQKEVWSSGNPTKYGKWHWEYSLDSGGSWTSVGAQWWFRENCTHMTAPQAAGSQFNLGAIGPDGHGATHWRMVLDAGPAFDGGAQQTQLRFNLEDVTGQAPPYTINFTDDTDGQLATVFIGPPGSPYVVRFSDNVDDGLNTLNFTNVPNPVLTIAFTDEGQFDTWSDVYPSIVVQTVVIATGR